ncbi:MAG: hypothetical protein K2G12_05355 [Prevotella sp.]|nr:hypothetical protein [Prevotella sp.]
MRNTISLLFLLLLLTTSGKAQTIKLNNAISANWSNNGSTLIYKYNPSIGIEYLECRHFMLSSNIGISYKAQEYPIYDGSSLEANIRYIELNTTARFKFDIKDMSFYIGAGPTIEWKKKSEFKMHEPINGDIYSRGEFRAKNNVVNIMTEIGAYKDFNRYRIELSASYKNNITNIIPESRKGFIGHSLLLSISLGYIL